MTQTELDTLLLELCAQPQEAPWLEFKHNYVHHDKIGQDISSMSNGATISNKPYGYLFGALKTRPILLKALISVLEMLKKVTRIWNCGFIN
ncbi:MAG: hypothetical protein QME42_06535 [bacterium]|nr:hypothetical protein [bacterium]